MLSEYILIDKQLDFGEVEKQINDEKESQILHNNTNIQKYTEEISNFEQEIKRLEEYLHNISNQNSEDFLKLKNEYDEYVKEEDESFFILDDENGEKKNIYLDMPTLDEFVEKRRNKLLAEIGMKKEDIQSRVEWLDDCRRKIDEIFPSKPWNSHWNGKKNQ